jgi:DNA transposition AAA+ family ATPase
VRASWNFSLDDIRSNIARYPKDAQEALVSAFLWCVHPEHPLAKPEFARLVGYSDNVIYKLYTGKYLHPKTGDQMDPPDDLVKNVRDFLALEKERFDARPTDFVVTPTAKRVFLAVDLARESQIPVILYGPSQIGKTWALRYCQAQQNHGKTAMVELEAASGLGGMVRQIADSVGISDKSNTASLIQRIKRALTPNMVLILDEVHLLKHTYRLGSFFACIEVLRRIHDFCKCGMVLSWTHLEELKAHKERELLQIWRRGVHKIYLPLMPTKDDLALILQHNGLTFPGASLMATVKMRDSRGRLQPITDAPYKVLRQLAKEEGLKSITERLRYANKLAKRAGEKVAWEHFLEAHLRIQDNQRQEGIWD